jgi:hypothetical protein
VHLEGTPGEIGFQHGYLLAPEIKDTFQDVSTEMAHDEKKPWEFFRKAAQEVFWPHIEQEYRDELTGIAEGLKARGATLDVWDVVALNAWLELPYYDKWLDKGNPSTTAGTGDHCSAFVATGSYTRDGRVVIGHNNWTSYASGERWNIMFDIAPAKGSRFLMDGMPGLIHSGDDFGVNAAGIIITETTITNFSGFDPDGVPEFVRARKAMQYAASIDDFARIMKEGNNGGYANNWLVADRKSNEIASLELGLKNVTLERTKDGFFVGANFPVDPKLTKEETTFDQADQGSQPERAAQALADADGAEQGPHRRSRRAAVPGGPLRRLRRQSPCQRAHPLRAYRAFAARGGHLGAALRALGRRSEQGDGCGGRGEDVADRRAGARLRHRLQSGAAPGRASRFRMAEGHSARHARAPVDALYGAVGRFSLPKRAFFLAHSAISKDTVVLRRCRVGEKRAQRLAGDGADGAVDTPGGQRPL